MEEVVQQLSVLRKRLEFAWSAETSASGALDPERPSAGQCAVTALIVQDKFGGELLRTVNCGESHYFNRLAGREVDLTRDQFPVWAPEEIVLRDRSYLEGHEATMSRYALLRERLASVS